MPADRRRAPEAAPRTSRTATRLSGPELELPDRRPDASAGSTGAGSPLQVSRSLFRRNMAKNGSETDASDEAGRGYERGAVLRASKGVETWAAAQAVVRST